jgi:hypothetical protein
VRIPGSGQSGSGLREAWGFAREGAAAFGRAGEPEIPPLAPPEFPPEQVPPGLPPGGPQEVPPEPPIELPPEQPPEVPHPPDPQTREEGE